ncbi:MAG: molybdopterin-dependent oxidoreductase [Vulcanimicrobiaceae bacterium]
MLYTRRGFVASAAATGAAGVMAVGANAAEYGGSSSVDLPMKNGRRPLAAYPQKQPMIVQANRPPILETPFGVFDKSDITPNDYFFVRWHEAGIPMEVDLSTFRLQVHGLVKKPLTLSVEQLQKDFEPVEVVAVDQCSGNSRGLFIPPVAGGEWANGAMGNARWKGARLKDVLAKAGVASGAKQMSYHGLDQGVLPATPRFKKALDIDMIMSNPDIIIAYEMNGEAMPLLNGFPIRLVVPGWFATYWVKMLSNIEIIDHVDANFWMATAYRIPDTPGGSVGPTQTGFKTIPINKMVVRSFVTNIEDGAFLSGLATGTGSEVGVSVRGIAFDGGSGIKKVEFSDDGGQTWKDTTLGTDLGKFSFRRWTTTWTATVGSGTHTIACRATANNGQQQQFTTAWNPAGYLKNNIETYKVSV